MLNDNINYRKALVEDLDALLQIEQKIIKAERPFDVTLKKNPINYYNLKELILSNDSELVVAAHNNKIISSGYALVKKAKPYLVHKEYAYLGFMFTAPAYRGKGVNKNIIKVLKEWAKAKGLAEVRLTVYDGNLPAIKAYEKAGFSKHIIEMRMNLNS